MANLVIFFLIVHKEFKLMVLCLISLGVWSVAGLSYGTYEICLYFLSLGAILRHHTIGYHIYADESQLYISFKCKDHLESLTKFKHVYF